MLSHASFGVLGIPADRSLMVVLLYSRSLLHPGYFGLVDVMLSLSALAPYEHARCPRQ